VKKCHVEPEPGPVLGGFGDDNEDSDAGGLMRAKGGVAVRTLTDKDSAGIRHPSLLACLLSAISAIFGPTVVTSVH